MNGKTPAPLTLGERLRYGLEAAAFFTGIGLLRLIGLEASSAVGGFVGRHLFYRVSAIMNRARANLTAAFPEKSQNEIETIVREMCDNLGRTVAEYAHLGKFKLEGDNPRLAIANRELGDAACGSGKGVMF